MSEKGVEQLVELGFTQYEAQAYVALLKESPSSGYELARRSAVPRANIYEVLDHLVERGIAMRVDEQDTTRFVPIASDELLGRLRRDFEETLDGAESSLRSIGPATRWDPVMNVRGYSPVMSLAKEIIASAESELLLAVWPQEAEALAPATANACERGVDTVTLCLAGCGHECGFCQGSVHRYRVAPDSRSRWLVLSSDGREVLSGEIRDDEAIAVRTRQRLVVELASWYIRHTIALAAIVRDPDARHELSLSGKTVAILRSVLAKGADRDWLTELRTIVAASDAKGK